MSANRFFFCVHAHQPVGNLPEIFLKAYEQSYKPFIDLLWDFPQIHLNFHITGELLEYLHTSHPEFLSKLRRMIDRGQVEMLGGAYYEPIMTMISPEDLQDQLSLMNEKLREYLGVTPKGAWIAERVWHPCLREALARAGIEYAVLDEEHLGLSVRIPNKSSFFALQGSGKPFYFFAASRSARYKIPFSQIFDVKTFLTRLPLRKSRDIVFADDCEKFGLWPYTYDWVYKKKWLEKFFIVLTRSQKYVKTHLFSSAISQDNIRPELLSRSPKEGSYREMTLWSRGKFDNFFTRYPESAYMRDRVLWQSRQFRKLRLYGKASEAQSYVLKAQCNCAYWHGVFGGHYLHHLRAAVFENLMRSERLLKMKASANVLPASALFAGDKHRILENADTRLFINLDKGASLSEWDDKKVPANLTCNLTRGREQYHDLVNPWKVLTGKSLFSIHAILGAKKSAEKVLSYDSYRKLCFMEHFLPHSQSLDTIPKIAPEWSWAAKRFHLRRASWESASLSCQGKLGPKSRECDVRLDKRYRLSSQTVKLEYQLMNQAKVTLSGLWLVELNLSVDDRKSLGSLSLSKGTSRWKIVDDWTHQEINFRFSRASDVLACPNFAYSGSEQGLESTYQGLRVFLGVPIHIPPGEALNYQLSIQQAPLRQDKVTSV